MKELFSFPTGIQAMTWNNNKERRPSFFAELKTGSTPALQSANTAIKDYLPSLSLSLSEVCACELSLSFFSYFYSMSYENILPTRFKDDFEKFLLRFSCTVYFLVVPELGLCLLYECVTPLLVLGIYRACKLKEQYANRQSCVRSLVSEV